ncbi:MAG: NfeD family protein [Bryobacterales bacterium]|nr:NfeD family protein [Bryobacterales bacterium]
METLSFAWWLWALVGLLLLAGELLTPGGFYLIFFGAGALAVGLLKLLLGIQVGLAMEGLVFVVISVAALALFRKPLLQRFQRLSPTSNVDNLTSEIATALEDIPAGGRGKAELRGTSWNAENLGDTPIAKATRCQVERVDGLTLLVRPL